MVSQVSIAKLTRSLLQRIKELFKASPLLAAQ